MNPTPPAADPAPYDVLVIGGGITGAGVARDAALRGLRVLLVEQGDFASGTSSRSSKLIHGGLRYLENFDLPLVFESCRERYILARLLPHLVRPLRIHLPVYADSRRPLWQVRLGVALYDTLALSREIDLRDHHSARALLARDPALRAEGLRGAVSFVDCEMDDARLCIETILDAARLGAVCRSYTRCLEVREAPGGYVARLLPAGADQPETVPCRAVVNAAGPWSDAVAENLPHPAPARLAPSRGLHLVLGRRVVNEAYLLDSPADGRLVFLLPQEHTTLVGTTESAVTDPDALQRETPEEARYLLRQLERVVPGAGVTPADVTFAFAGTRPLVRAGGDPQALGRLSRRHTVVRDGGILTVVGGKYTIFRQMAEDCVDALVAHLRPARQRVCVTRARPYACAAWKNWEEDLVTAAAAWTAVGVAAEHAERIVETYAASHLDLLRLAEATPELRAPLGDGHRLAVELVHAFRNEAARSLEDALLRRLGVWALADTGLGMLPAAVETVSREGLLPREEAERQAESFANRVRRSREIAR